MKEHPILFSTPMVQAILDGKTQTRRIIKPQPTEFVQEYFGPVAIVGTHRGLKLGKTCPYGYGGDLLWVKETWKPELVDAATSKPETYYYLADNPAAQRTGIKFKPSIHMPKSAARIWLQIEEIRAERLQDISEQDAIAEGVGAGFQMNAGWPDYQFIKNGVCTLTQDTPEMSFASLWDSINDKPGSLNWHANPWVWAITFKVISTNGKPNLES